MIGIGVARHLDVDMKSNENIKRKFKFQNDMLKNLQHKIFSYI